MLFDCIYGYFVGLETKFYFQGKLYCIGFAPDWRPALTKLTILDEKNSIFRFLSLRYCCCSVIVSNLNIEFPGPSYHVPGIDPKSIFNRFKISSIMT